MSPRHLDPDDDYAYDRTNRPASRSKAPWIAEMEARAKKCLSYQEAPNVRGACINCNGVRYAHSVHALRLDKAS